MEEQNQRDSEIEDITFATNVFKQNSNPIQTIIAKEFLDCCTEEAGLKRKETYLSCITFEHLLPFLSYNQIDRSKQDALTQVKIELDYIQGKKAFLKKVLENYE